MKKIKSVKILPIKFIEVTSFTPATAIGPGLCGSYICLILRFPAPTFAAQHGEPYRQFLIIVNSRQTANKFVQVHEIDKVSEIRKINEAAAEKFVWLCIHRPRTRFSKDRTTPVDENPAEPQNWVFQSEKLELTLKQE